MTQDQKQKDAERALVLAMQDLTLAQEKVLEYQRKVMKATRDLRTASADVVAVVSREDVKSIRPEVMWFAEQMEKNLCANDHKGGWEDEYLDDLLKRLFEEVDELSEMVAARKGLHIISEAADVANYCMMLADRVRE